MREEKDRGLQPLGATDDGSAKDLFEGQNPSITKREMDFYYGGRTGVVSPPPSNFFGPRQRKPTSSELGLRKHSSEKCAGMPCNETICWVTEGSSVHHAQSSSGLMPFTGADVCHEPPSEKRKRCPDEMLSKHRTQISSDDGAHIVGQSSDSHTNAVQPPKRTRRTGQPCINNDACHSVSTTHALATNACSVIQPSSSESAQNLVEPQKRSRRRKESSASDAAHHSPSNTQASASHACSVTEPSGSHVVQNVAQPRKRIRRTPQASTQSTNNITETSTSYAPPITEMANSHGSQNVAQPRKRIRRTPQASTHSTNNIAETSTSYAPPITEMANSHASQSATQPQKRNRRTRQSSTGQPNDRSQNISEGSTSHTVENTSLTYDDLRDCTECCNYCNAAFWRGERLAGHSYGTHVSHYHLCCGNGKVFMQPEPDPPEYIKQLLGDATFMENIRAYNQMFAMISFGATIDSTLYIYDTKNEVRNRSNPFSNPDSPPLDPEVVQGLIHFLDAHNDGKGPRGYELPSSNSLGAIVFDRGLESESNYDVVLEYRDGPVKRISKIHKSYMSLQFPLIFIYG
ncbi:hypothetical protein CTI12_AA043880 [Artemisia annua]|uniref:C2H2-type domain-containing protein n=1 Tax=Artemisia annua TaxID=35608 RepID=A0A2U1P6T9_ARTAN|nr:hypothetical protein CTI12_AA043880 [Artemisia annua]